MLYFLVTLFPKTCVRVNFVPHAMFVKYSIYTFPPYNKIPITLFFIFYIFAIWICARVVTKEAVKHPVGNIPIFSGVTALAQILGVKTA